jgi:hypothetical protein
VAVVVALLPVAGMFSTSTLFPVRDLVMYFWPKHRWLRATILSGQWPWWDPYMAGGQSAAADALLQMFFAPTLLLRLVLPEVLGFNLWVGLPFPLAALGTYLFARRHLSRQASALAAIVFAVSGPIVSTSDFPNLSWSALALPWVLWAMDRYLREPTGRAFVLLACCVAGQAFSGEPVTMTATLALATAYAAWRLPECSTGFLPRLRRMSLLIAAMAVGIALSAIQLLPLWHAAAQSVRSGTGPEYAWSLHPASVVETIAPFLFGDNFQWSFASFPWMRAFSSGREPFFYSTYCSVAVFAIALLGLFTVRRRWGLFWGATLLLALLLAFGNYTPLYPALQQMIGLMRAFRYPPKYLVLAVLALAMLAGYGWQALASAAAQHEPLAWRMKAPAIGLAVLLAIVGYAATLMALLFRGALIDVIYRIALAVGVPDLPVAVSGMLASAEPHGRRLLLLSTGTAFLLWIAAAGRRESRLACAALFGLLCADLVVTNAHVTVMHPVSYLDRPEWVRLVQEHPAERFYFGGRLRGWIDQHDIDAPPMARPPAWANAVEVRTVMQGEIVMVPSPWRIREALSYDLPMLFPVDYERVVSRFEAAPREQRRRFLSAAGVRDCIVPAPPVPGATALTQVPGLDDMKLYECDPSASRVRVVPPWGWVEPSVSKQIDLLFRPEFDVRKMVLMREDPPPPAGTVGPAAAAPYARFTKDEGTEVEVAAGVGADGGFLVLMDSFDEDWHADVDGHPARLLQANGVYRAVRLVPGPHLVRFSYRPRHVLYGALVSGSAFIGLCAIALLARRPQPAGLPAPVPSPATLEDMPARSAHV